MYTKIMDRKIPRPLRILLVDDDQTFNRVVEAHLVKGGFRVDAFFDGIAALAAYDKQPYDMAVVDLVMPKMPGFVVIEELRKRSKTLPIATLTLLHQEEDIEKVKKLGATKYFSKASPGFMDEIVKYAEEVSVS